MEDAGVDVEPLQRSRSVSWANDDCLVQILGELEQEGHLDAGRAMAASTSDQSSSWAQTLFSSPQVATASAVEGESVQLQVQECIRYTKGSLGSPKIIKKKDRTKEARRFYSHDDLKALVNESESPAKSDELLGDPFKPFKPEAEENAHKCEENLAFPRQATLAPCLEDGFNEGMPESPGFGPSSGMHSTSPLNPQPSLSIPHDEEMSGLILGDLELDDPQEHRASKASQDIACNEESGTTSCKAQHSSAARRHCSRETRSPKGGCAGVGRASARSSQATNLGGLPAPVPLSHSLPTSLMAGRQSGPPLGVEADQPSGLTGCGCGEASNASTTGTLFASLAQLSAPKPDLSRWDRQWERLRSMIDDALEPNSI